MNVHSFYDVGHGELQLADERETLLHVAFISKPFSYFPKRFRVMLFLQYISFGRYCIKAVLRYVLNAPHFH